MIGLIALSDLLTPSTADDVEAEILATLETLGFQVTSWGQSAAPRLLIRAFSVVVAALTVVLFQLTASAFLSFAVGRWLTVLAKDVYDIDRDPAVAVEGTFLLTDEASGGPYTITAGVTRFQTSDGSKVFVATTGGTLTLDGTLAVTVQATLPGSSYNLPNGTALVFVTDLPGVSVANPDPGSGTWITTAGQDEQTDASLRSECKAKWGTLAMGVAKDAYVAWSKQASSAVTRVKVYDDNPIGPGTVRIVVAGAAGGITVGELAAVDAFVRPRKALGTSTLQIDTASNVAISVEGTIYVLSSQREAAETAIAEALAALSAETEIGTEVALSSVYEAIAGPTGVTKATVADPTGDTSLGDDEVPTFTTDLTFVEV